MIGDDPQVVLPVGGRGTRMGPLTAGTPKCLLPVAGRPFLEYVLEWFARQGFRNFLLCSGYFADAVIAAIGDGARLGVTVRHSVEPAPLGVVGALRHAGPLLGEVFVLCYGDVYHKLSCDRLITYFRSVDRPAVMSVVPALQDGNTTVADGLVVAYAKGAPPGTHSFLDAGQLVLSRAVLGEESDEEQLFSRLARSGQLAAYVAGRDQAPYDIGSPEGYAQFCTAASGRGL